MHVYVGGYVARGPDRATQQGEGRYGIYQGGLPDLGVQIHNSQLHLHFRYMNNRIVAVFPFICNSDEVLHPVFYLATPLSRMLCNTGGDKGEAGEELSLGTRFRTVLGKTPRLSR